jgi:hypothetical protein
MVLDSDTLDDSRREAIGRLIGDLDEIQAAGSPRTRRADAGRARGVSAPSINSKPRSRAFGVAVADGQ